MNIFSLLTFTCFLFSLYFAYDTIRSNSKSLLNQIYFILLLSYSVWCFGYVFFYPAQTVEAVNFWCRFALSGLALLSPTFLLFSIVYVMQKKEIKNYIFLLTLYIPAYLIIYNLIKGGLIINPIMINGMWVIKSSGISWVLILFFMQNFTFPLLGIIIIFVFGLRTKNKRMKIQAFIMAVSIFIPVILTTLISYTSLIIKDLYFRKEMFLLNFNHLFVFMTFAAFKYAMSKYRLMQITPLSAFKNILLDIHDFIIIFDSSENIIDINNELIRLVEYRKDEISSGALNIFMNQKVLNLKSIIEKTNRYKTFTSEISFFTKKGNKVPVNIYASMIRDKYDELIGYIIVGHDIIEKQELEIEKAERQLTEKSLIASETKYKLTIDSMSDIIYVIEKNFTVILCNQALYDFVERFGFNRNKIIGFNLFEAFPVFNDKLKDIYKGVFEDGLMRITEEKFIMGSSLLTAEIRLIPVIEKKSITKIITIMRDVTFDKKNEEHMLRISRLDSLGVLAGGIAHDFNNMLTGILGNINLAKYTLDKKSPENTLLTEAERAALKAKDLTYQLLTFSKGGEPLKKPGSIVNLVRESSDFVLRGSSITVKYDFDDDIQPVEFDHGQMSSVIHNIILNAREAMDKGGLISIAVKNCSLMDNDLLHIPEGDYIKIIITDNGPGIEKEILPKIFDPYFSTKKNGSGLGLAISFSIIKKHGGFIDVISSPGKGTSFYIFMPRHHAVIDNDAEKNIEDAVCAYSILFMDDDDMIIKVSKRLLKHLGCRTVFVGNGGEALAVYEKTWKKGKPFDLIILDLTIKGGMGGRETFDYIVKINPDVKAIVCSGYSNDPIMAEYRKFGFKGVIKKPFDINDLKKEIINVMNYN